MHRFEVPGAATQFGPLDGLGVRVDTGVVDGSEVSVFYDPMLAKVISYAPTRRQAAGLLADALARTRIHGVRTNRDLLVNVLRHPAFLDGATDTAFFDTHGLAELAAPLADRRAVELSALAAALADAAQNRQAATVFAAAPSGWRNVASGFQTKRYSDSAGETHEVRYRFTRGGVELPDDDAVTLVSATPDRVVLAVDGVDRPFDVARYGDDVFVDSPLGPVQLVALPRFPDPAAAVAHGSLLAPMPGSVLRVGAAVGDTVAAGQPLIWLEAMKMEHTVTAPSDGVLVELDVEPGQQVDVGAVLAVWTTLRRRPMTANAFVETEERQALRKAVAAMAANYGQDYYLEKARAGGHTDELWQEAGKLGFLGVNLPEEYGGGGAGMYELSVVMEEMAADGCPLLLMVVSPAICGTIIAKFGTEEQKKRWLPGIADGSITMAFAITEPDAGSNSHRITTTARRDGGDWILNGPEDLHLRRRRGAGGARRRAAPRTAKTGNAQARAVRRADRRPGLRPGPRSRWRLVSPESQFQVFLDDVRLPADALVGAEDAAIAQLFAGLNPERIMGAASAVGMGRFALDKAVDYVKTRAGVEDADRRAPGPRRTRWRRTTSRSSWPS